MFLKFIGKRAVTKQIVEQYILSSKNRRNNLAMLKVVYPDLVKDIKFPKSVFKPKILPSRQQLRVFYDALPDNTIKSIFLLLASSGLRSGELMNSSIDTKNHMLIPNGHEGSTKHSYVSFYNKEAASMLPYFNRMPIDSVGRIFSKVSEQNRHQTISAPITQCIRA